MAYQEMATLYDKLMLNAPYDEWIAFTEQVLNESGKNITKIADLGCGTGEITTRLAQAGYSMTGIDYSADMLTYAAHKASEKNLSIQWLQQDLINLTGLMDYDAAISFCDVINYITEPAELEKTFQNVAESLKPGGIFMFDVHSLFQVEQHYINQTFADVTEEASYIWFCSAGDERGEMFHDLTFFALDGEDYKRFDEYHHQKTYSVDFYKNLLRHAGFENLKVFADFSLKQNFIEEKAERIFFLAEKRSE
ncbi:class I SAM-dependent DNA methyltransferase [Oceanobacillus massiliensis]|uniref:class I SAM-dependent DNA methyltransferase n=1 Tax=Oceanobacillus massiliensis TaxID=1465765 RepID=UPI000289CAF9|nr:class I SAM-dependent methyltransferase [Oceanobacillus massiliensis]